MRLFDEKRSPYSVISPAFLGRLFDYFGYLVKIMTHSNVNDQRQEYAFCLALQVGTTADGGE